MSKTAFINRKSILYVKYVFVIALLACGFYSIFWGTEEYYETIRLYYLWKGIFWILLGFCISIADGIPSKWICIVGAGLTVGLIGYLFILGGGIDIWRWYGFRGLSCILAFVLLLNAFVNKSLSKFSSLNIPAIIIFFIPIIWMFVIGKRSDIIWLPLLICGCMCLIDVNKARWDEFCECFLWGYIVMGFNVMIRSFIAVPYAGGRYYGVWGNHGLFSSGIGGCVIALLILIYMTFQHKNPYYRQKLVFEIVLLIFFGVSVVIISARIAMLGIFLASYILLFLILNQKNKTKGIILVSVCFILLIGVFVGVLYYLQNIPEEKYDVIKIETLKQIILYWRDRGSRLFMKESRTGFFKGGTFLNAIDGFSSSRLTWALKYCEHLNLLGHESLWVYPEDYMAMSHPHNTYIAWLYLYGIISGVAYIINFLFASVSALVRSKNETNITPVAVFCAYLFGIFFGDVFLNGYLELIVLFILIRPILFKREKIAMNTNSNAK